MAPELRGTAADGVVELLDLYPTLLDLAGLSWDPPAEAGPGGAGEGGRGEPFIGADAGATPGVGPSTPKLSHSYNATLDTKFLKKLCKKK